MTLVDAIALVGGISSEADILSNFHLYLLDKDIWVKLKYPSQLVPRYNFGVSLILHRCAQKTIFSMSLAD